MFWEVIDERAERLAGVELVQGAEILSQPPSRDFGEFLDDLEYALQGPFSSTHDNVMVIPEDDPSRAVMGIVLLRREADGCQYALRICVTLTAILVARREDLQRAEGFLVPYRQFHIALTNLCDEIVRRTHA